MPETTTPTTLRAGFRSVVLVCRSCEKRSKGPKGLAAKDVARQLKRACRGFKAERPRVVATSCLGACPKKAMTLAALRPGRAPSMVALRRRDSVEAAAAALFDDRPAGQAASNSTSSAPSPT